MHVLLHVDTFACGGCSKSEINKSYLDGLVQDCSIYIANTLKIYQFRTKPSIYFEHHCHNKSINSNMSNVMK